MENKQELKSMVNFILDMDWLTTTEFCAKYSVPLPVFTGEVKSSADQFLKIDAIKYRMIVEYAKFLNREISYHELHNSLKFTNMLVRAGSYPEYRNGKFKITNDELGYRLEPYDSVDGRRIHKVEDLVGLGLHY